MKILDNLHAFLWLNPTENNSNSYLIIEGEKKILVDPGHYHLFNHVRDGLSRLSLSPQDMDLVIITHGHPDHVEGIKEFKETHTLIAINAVEMNFIRKAGAQYGNALGIPDFEPDILLQEGDLKIGDLTLRVIHTPGHSPGSICLYWAKEKALFTGDVVFHEGIGRTDLPGGKGEELKESIREISRLQVEYLLPGHGEILSGSRNVQTNFKEIEEYWFAYI